MGTVPYFQMLYAYLNARLGVSERDERGSVTLEQVIITGLTVENALFEGVLVVSASDITIQDNHIIDNDKTPGLNFTGALTGCPGQPGNGIYETDETGDCGGALHLVGTANSIISGNLVTGNAAQPNDDPWAVRRDFR